MATAVKDKLVTVEDLQIAYNELKGELDEMGTVSTANLTFISNLQTSGATVTKFGNVVQFNVSQMKLASDASSVGSGTVICTIPQGYRPKVKTTIDCICLGHNGVLIDIDVDGKITNQDLISAGLNVEANYHAFYICA